MTSTELQGITARTIAASAGIAPRTKRFILRDEYDLAYDGGRTEHVLAALSRSDKTPGLGQHTRKVAYSIYKCLTTGRMNPTLSLRIQGYSPYRVCALVAKVASTTEESIQIGELADDWINQHADQL
jgi:hypothetical protein